MSDPNSNTAEAGASLAAGATGASGEDQNPHITSVEGSEPKTAASTPEHVESDVAHVVGTETSIEASSVSIVQSIDDSDLHSAVVSTTDAAMFNVDYTLDQLINSSDLFDVPAFDFSDDLPT